MTKATMTPHKFVTSIRTSVVDENISMYRDIFSSTSSEDASDAYWKRALALFGGLTHEQKEVFFEVLRQVAVDTTSNILGVLDGITAINGSDTVVKLLNSSSQELSGDLQSIFLTDEENRR